MPKILFLNDYPMGKAKALCELGEYPSHHLWGMKEINEFGFEVVYFPDNTWLGAPQKYKFSIQQLQAWILSQDVDLVYSACQFNTWLLARLRLFGLLKKPLITVVHHPLKGVLQNKSYVTGHDLLVFMNESLEAHFRKDFSRSGENSIVIPWGADLDFTHNISPDGPRIDVIAAGKTNRDFSTLIKSATNSTWSMSLYCANRNLEGIKDIPSNVSIHSNESGIVLGYKELYQQTMNSRIVAVPLIEVNALAGLTSALDAIALGKPLVMTKNRWLDLDPEKEGFGKLVEVGDEIGWRKAIDAILSNPELEKEMGQNARNWANKVNSRSFSKGLANAFTAILSNKRI